MPTNRLERRFITCRPIGELACRGVKLHEGWLHTHPGLAHLQYTKHLPSMGKPFFTATAVCVILALAL